MVSSASSGWYCMRPAMTLSELKRKWPIEVRVSRRWKRYIHDGKWRLWIASKTMNVFVVIEARINPQICAGQSKRLVRFIEANIQAQMRSGRRQSLQFLAECSHCRDVSG